MYTLWLAVVAAQLIFTGQWSLPEEDRRQHGISMSFERAGDRHDDQKLQWRYCLYTVT